MSFKKVNIEAIQGLGITLLGIRYATYENNKAVLGRQVYYDLWLSRDRIN